MVNQVPGGYGEFRSNTLIGEVDDTGVVDATLPMLIAMASFSRIYVPPGNYLFNSGALAPSVLGQHIYSDHRAGCNFISNNNSIFNFSGPSTESFELDHITLQATGFDVVSGCNMKRAYVHDAAFIQNSATNSCWNGILGIGQSMVECGFERNEWTVNGAIRSAPCIFLGTANANSQINNNHWRDDVFFNAQNDQSQYLIHIQNSAAGGLNQTNDFEGLLAEHPYGGFIWLESHTGGSIERCFAYDIPNTGTISNNLFQISKNATGAASGRNNIVRSGRIQGVVAFAAGIGDIMCDASTYATLIEAPNGSGGLVMYLNGSKAKLVGMPDGGWGIQDSAIGLAAGAQAGTGAPTPVATLTPDNASGTVTFGTGTGPAAGAMVVVTFGNPFQTTPAVQLSPLNGASFNLGLTVSAISATGFTVSAINAPAASQGVSTYGFRWLAPV